MAASEPASKKGHPGETTSRPWPTRSLRSPSSSTSWSRPQDSHGVDAADPHGNAETGIFDRSSTSSLSLQGSRALRDRRLQLPAGCSKNFIARIIGMPGRSSRSAAGTPNCPEVRRTSGPPPPALDRDAAPAPRYRGAWKTSTGTAGRWRIKPSSSGDEFCHGSRRGHVPQTYESIRDNYVDGYPEASRTRSSRSRRGRTSTTSPTSARAARSATPAAARS